MLLPITRVCWLREIYSSERCTERARPAASMLRGRSSEHAIGALSVRCGVLNAGRTLGLRPAFGQAHLEEDAHERVDHISAALHGRDVSGCGAGDGVAVELTSEVQHSAEELVSIHKWQLPHLRDPAFQQEHLEYLALRPLHQQDDDESRQLVWDLLMNGYVRCFVTTQRHA